MILIVANIQKQMDNLIDIAKEAVDAIDKRVKQYAKDKFGK